MNPTTFFSTSQAGITRARPTDQNRYTVETIYASPDVCCLTTDPTDRTTLYAGTRDKGLLRSVDSGETWRSVGLAGKVVKSIALTPAAPHMIIVGTKPPALYASYDAGQTWTELTAFRQLRQWFWFTPAEPGDPYVMGLSIAPTHPQVIIAGVEFGGVFRSTDGGQTWEGHLRGTSRDCHALTFHAHNSDWVYQAGGGWPAAASSTGGKTWSQPRRGLRWSLYGMACAADPQNPEVWYVSAAPHAVFPDLHKMPRGHWDGSAHASIFRMTGDGRWRRLTGGLPQPLNHMAYALVTDRDAPGHLYAGLSNGDVWHTGDYGDHWQQLPFNLGGIRYSLAICNTQA